MTESDTYAKRRVKRVTKRSQASVVRARRAAGNRVALDISNHDSHTRDWTPSDGLRHKQPYARLLFRRLPVRERKRGVWSDRSRGYGPRVEHGSPRVFYSDSGRLGGKRQWLRCSRPRRSGLNPGRI